MGSATLLIATALLLGCPSSVKVPAPERGGNPSIAPATAAPSVIPIAVSADLAPLIALMKSMVKDPLISKSQRMRVVDKVLVKVDAHVDYTARLADATVSLAGDNLTLSAVVEFKLKLKVAASGLGGRLRLARGVTSCGHGEPMPRIRLTIEGKLRTVPGPALRFERRAWKKTWERHCKVTALGFRLERVLDLPFIRSRVDRAVERALAKAPTNIDLAARVDRVWRRLQRAHSLTPGSWLILRARSLAIAPVRGRGTVLSTRLSLRAQPKVIIGSKPVATTTAMPDVTIGSPRPRIELALRARLSFEAAAQQFAAVPGVRRVRLYDSRGKLAVGVSLNKPVRGTVYMIGTPIYDPGAATLSMPDLDFTSESRAALVGKMDARALATLARGLRRAAVFKLDETTQRTMAVLRDKTLGGGAAAVRLRVTGVRDHRVWVNGDGLHFSAVLTGSF